MLISVIVMSYIIKCVFKKNFKVQTMNSNSFGYVKYITFDTHCIVDHQRSKVTTWEEKKTRTKETSLYVHIVKTFSRVRTAYPKKKSELSMPSREKK